MVSELLREGKNHRIDIDDGVVRLAVWRNAELSYEEGAQAAAEIREALDRAVTTAGVRALFYDLREGPTVAGPKTREQIGLIFGAFHGAGHRVAVLVRDDAVMRMQMERLTADSGGESIVTDDEASALAFARGR